MSRSISLLAYVILVVGTTSTYAQLVEFPISFLNETPSGVKGQMFTFAAHPLGTSELDTALGEREIPSIPPPAGIFIVYTVPPASEYLWLSPKDVRQLKPGVRFREDYNVNILWTGGTLTMTWDYPMPALVDSAYLVDVITDFPDNFIKVKIQAGTSFSTDNPALTRFKVLVWYNGTTSDVDEFEESKLTLFPNPTNDVVVLNGVAEGSTISVFSLHGVTHSTNQATSSVVRLDLSTLAPGAYGVRVVGPDGSITSRIIMRQ